MQVTLTEAPQRFADAAGQWLAHRPVENNLLLGQTMGGTGHRTAIGALPAVFAWIESDARVVGAAWVHAPARMIVSVMPVRAVGGLATLLAARQVAVPGIGGPAEVAAEFARHWTDLTGRPALRERQRQLLRCDAVSWPRRSPGRARPARPDDLDLIAEWLAASPPDTDLAGPPGRAPTAAALAAAQAAGRLLVWDDAGPVGAAGWPEPVARVARPAICVRPGYRGRGYEPALVAAATAQALASGCVAGLCHSDQASARAAVLPQVGYRFVQDVAEYRFGPEPAGPAVAGRGSPAARVPVGVPAGMAAGPEPAEPVDLARRRRPVTAADAGRAEPPRCPGATVHLRRPMWTVERGPGAGAVVVELAGCRGGPAGAGEPPVHAGSGGRRPGPRHRSARRAQYHVRMMLTDRWWYGGGQPAGRPIADDEEAS